MKKRKLILLLLAIVALASCKSDDAEGLRDGNVPIRLTASMETVATRMADVESLTGSQLSDGLGVGVYVFDDYSPIVNNQRTTSSGGSLSMDSPIFFPQNGHSVKIYAYAPYTTDFLSCSVKGDQSSIDGYKASDLMWGRPVASDGSDGNPVAPTSNAIPLKFQHRLTRMVVKLTPGNDFNMADLANATVKTCIVNSGYIFQVDTGEAVVDAYTPRPNTITFGTIADGEQSESVTFTAIVVPQTFRAGTKLINIVLADGRTLSYELPQDMTFNNNTQYSFDIKVAQTKLTLNGTSIKPWIEQEVEQSKDLQEGPYNLANLTETLRVTEDMEITGNTTQSIVIAEGATLTLNGVRIAEGNITCEGNATIYLKGNNVIKSNIRDKSGIETGPINTMLTINADDDATLDVMGGTDACGIGRCGANMPIGDGSVTINGGNITARANGAAAAIGAGYWHQFGQVIINGGNIRAIGCRDNYQSLGIGGGENDRHGCLQIIINGGNVYAESAQRSAIECRGINSGANSYGLIIANATVEAVGPVGIKCERYSTTISNSNITSHSLTNGCNLCIDANTAVKITNSTLRLKKGQGAWDRYVPDGKCTRDAATVAYDFDGNDITDQIGTLETGE